MSQLPLLGASLASWVVRSAMERCWNEALLKVMGLDSSVVEPAELASGVKSENRVPEALATPIQTTDTATATPAASAGIATRVHFDILTFLPFGLERRLVPRNLYPADANG